MLDFHFLLTAFSGIGFWFALVMGLVIGSFLNVIIHRIPKLIDSDVEISSGKVNTAFPLFSCLVFPVSTTPCCHVAISWRDNIPLISWLVLRGRCRNCGSPIRARYLLVELISGISFAGVFLVYGQSWATVFYSAFFALLIALFWIDLETYFLPDALTYTLLWLGLLGSSIDVLPLTTSDAVMGACIGYLAIWSSDAAYYLWRKRHGFGGGDFKLLAALGAWLGAHAIMPILLIASVLAIVVMGIWGMWQRKRMALENMIPFGPFLIMAGCLLLWLEKELF